MTVTPLLPIQGVPTALIEALNMRFRELSGDSASVSSSGKPGVFFATKARPDANGTPVGTFGTDTDTGVLYQVQTVRSSQSWVYASGILRADFADAPVPGVYDAGLLWHVKDYAHLLRWSGTGWEFLDQMGGYIAGRVVAPDGNGWQLCDGSATHYLHCTALGVVSEVALTTPNLNATAAYQKWAAAYTGTIVAANAPGTTGQNVTAGAVPVVKTVDATGEPSHLNMLPYFRR